MNILQSLTGSVALLLVSAMAGASDYRTFRDYAPVVHVEPIVEYSPAIARVECDNRQDERPVETSIGRDVRQQELMWRRYRNCRRLQAEQREERISGYRVTYEYNGHQSTTQLSYNPGNRLPVNISLTPFP